MRSLRIGLVIYFLLLAALAVLLRGAAPGPAAQVVQGVRLGAWEGAEGTVYFSGQRLRCEPAADSDYAEACRAEIAGQALTLAARPRRMGDSLTARGVCVATYGGRAWPCTLQSHHTYPGATVAHLVDPLGLDAGQMSALRRRFPIENLPETTMVHGALILWPLTALALVLALVAVWPYGRVRRAYTGLVFAAWSMIALLGTPWVLAFLTRGFWD